MATEAMDYGLTEDEVELAAIVREFSEIVVAPQAYQAYSSHKLSLDVLAQMGELGLFGLPFPEEYGGQGGTYSPCALQSKRSRASTNPSRSLWKQQWDWARCPFTVSAQKSRRPSICRHCFQAKP
jgi:alkylation response protein AidB-like acyl-CoA dehydrogenase